MTIYRKEHLGKILHGEVNQDDKCEWCYGKQTQTDHIMGVQTTTKNLNFIFTVCDACRVKHNAPQGYHIMVQEWYHRKKELKVFGGYDGGT